MPRAFDIHRRRIDKDLGRCSKLVTFVASAPAKTPASRPALTAGQKRASRPEMHQQHGRRIGAGVLEHGGVQAHALAGEAQQQRRP